MKFTLFFMILGIMNVFAVNSYSQSGNVTLNFKNTKVEVVLNQIEKNSGYYFAYNQKLINVNRKVDILANNKAIKEVLHDLFKNTNTDYVVINRQIVLSPKQITEEEVADIQQQKKGVTITGSIVDAKTGESLPGVSVLIKGTSKGSVSDSQGKFSLTTTNPEVTLSISFMGYESQEVLLSGKTSISVSLVSKINNLDEVVVIGYGSVKKSDLTGSVASIKTESLKSVPVVGLNQLMQGQTTGVQITANSGAPGAGFLVQIRGMNSFGSNAPLYVIDGVPLEEPIGGNYPAISTINPDDIESIDILKDASASAIYGTRAANGVVVITTKQGKNGSAKISFNSYLGFQQPMKLTKMLNSQQFGDFINGMTDAAGTPRLTHFATDSLKQNTDWQKEIYKTAAPIRNYQISIGGGNEKTHYFISGGYFNQQGIVMSSGFERYSFRVNVDSKVKDWLKVGTTLTYGHTKGNNINSDNQFSPVIDAMMQQPNIPVKFADGSWGGPVTAGSGDVRNSVATLTEEKHNSLQNRLFGNIYAEITLLKGLTFRSSLGIDNYYSKSKDFVPHYIVPLSGNINSGNTSENYNTFTNSVFDNTLTFARVIGDHSFTALAGMSFEQQGSSWNSLYTDGFWRTDKKDISMGDINSLNRQLNGGNSAGVLLSYFSRLIYSYKGKYLFTGTVRRDGSYKFGPENKFGTFPSASLGWILSEEEFMKNIKPITTLKLRASYGATGNQRIPDYQYLATMGAGGADHDYSLGGIVAGGKSPSGVPNPAVHWENTKQLDLGIDLLLYNRITLNVDYYNKVTDGLLQAPPLAPSTGFSTGPSMNIGKVSNKGVEFMIRTDNLTGKFKWNTIFNISFNKNKFITLFNHNPISTYYTRTEEGQPMHQYSGLQVEKIFQSKQEARSFYTVTGADTTYTYPNASGGDIKWKDINGDGKIDDKDKTYLGSPFPKYIFGLTNTFSFNGIDLSIFLQGNYGNKLYYANGGLIEREGDYINQSDRVLNRWISPTQPGDGKMPRSVFGDPNGNHRDNTSRWIEDGSFIRVKNITLGYTLPTSVASKLKLSLVRLYFTANNLYTFTKYPGVNPEIGAVGGSTDTYGIDTGNYPVARSYTFGLNIDF